MTNLLRLLKTIGIGCYLFSISAQASPPIQDVYLGLGLYPSEKNIAFYTPSSYQNALEVQVAPSSEVIADEFPASAARYAVSSKPTYTDHRSHKAVIRDLAINTAYSYRIGNDTDGWSDTHQFSVFDTDHFNFLVAGDPQIGAAGFSNGSTMQAIWSAEKWQRVMSQAVNLYPQSSFFIAPGDVVQRPYENYFKALLSQNIVKTLPSIMLEASHDDDGEDKENSIFHQHIFQPAPAYPDQPHKGFFWFKYGDALFIHADYSYWGNIDPRQYIAEAVEQFPESKWRIFIMHYSYYAGGFHANADVAPLARQQLSPTLDNMGIDLVIFGHDHAYLRTPQLLNDQVVPTQPHPGDPMGALDPAGAVYLQANSSSGSKYYSLKNDIHSRYYVALARQNHTPSFINIDINGNDLTIKSYEVDDDNNVEMFDQYRIHKTGIRPVLSADYDSDGYLNEDDAFPFDPTEWRDLDGDGIGDNADTDDDGDGIDDVIDPFPSSEQHPAQGTNHCLLEHL